MIISFGLRLIQTINFGYTCVLNYYYYHYYKLLQSSLSVGIQKCILY